MNPKRVFLVNPCDDFLEKRGDRPPLGLLYLSSYVKKFGYEPKVVDLNHLNQHYLYGYVVIYKPKYVCFSLSTPNYKQVIEMAQEIRKLSQDIVLIAGGNHATDFPDEELTLETFDHIIVGDGEKALLEILDNVVHVPKIIKRPSVPLDDLPLPDYEAVNMKDYTMTVDGRKGMMIATQRGCPFSCCLTGDTTVNTIEGEIPIKDLVGRDIGVYTYNPKTKKTFISDATNIHLAKTNTDIVKVTFDDGTHIRCTPDHPFLTFKNGNQFNNLKETQKEAKDLSPKESVRAVKFRTNAYGYKVVEWARRSRVFQHRMVMEYKLGRPLIDDEVVHHINHNRADNRIENLQLMSGKDHSKLHASEVRKRMIENNASRNMTKEFRKRLGEMQKGKKRSFETRMLLRKSKLGKNNPNWKHGGRAGAFRDNESKILAEINHKVVSVEPAGKADVYDLSVPETQWFFANKVLVHNSFCGSANKPFTKSESIEKTILHMKHLYDKYKVRGFYFVDDTFTYDMKKTIKLCEEIAKFFPDIVFRCTTRANCLTDEVCAALKKAGCTIVSIGLESADPTVLIQINKLESVDQQKRGVEMCHKHGLKTKGFFIFGLPGATFEGELKTIEMAKELSVDYADAYIFTPYPGTPIWEDPEKYNMKIRKPKDNDWNNFFQVGKDGLPPTFQFEHPNLTEQQLRGLVSRFNDQVKAGGLTY